MILQASVASDFQGSLSAHVTLKSLCNGNQVSFLALQFFITLQKSLNLAYKYISCQFNRTKYLLMFVFSICTNTFLHF